MEATKQLHEALELALKLLDPIPCTGQKAKSSCIRQFEGKFDKEGRPVLFFGEGCKVVEKFCPSCRAYWHVATARNAVFDVDRITGLLAREAVER